MTTRTWWLRVAMAVCAVSVAAACGGSDGSGSTQGAGDAAESATGGGDPSTDGGGTDGAGNDDPSTDGGGGGGDDGKGEAERISSCEVVTAAEIEGLLGAGAVGEGQLVGNVCSWPVGEASAVGVSVIETTDVTMTAEEGVASMREGFGAAAIELADLGDEAVTDGAGMLAFRSGDWYVTVGVYVGDTLTGQQAAAESLAHLVVGRL